MARERPSRLARTVVAGSVAAVIVGRLFGESWSDSSSLGARFAVVAGPAMVLMYAIAAFFEPEPEPQQQARRPNRRPAPKRRSSVSREIADAVTPSPRSSLRQRIIAGLLLVAVVAITAAPWFVQSAPWRSGHWAQAFVLSTAFPVNMIAYYLWGPRQRAGWAIALRAWWRRSSGRDERTTATA